MLKPINIRPVSTGKIVPEIDANRSSRVNTQPNQSFSDILSSEVSKNSSMKFSAHAVKRMQERSISLTDKDLGDLKEAVTKASDKGIRESLVVMKDVALIVNIPNKTVITAVDGKNLKENIFTNIDGAVFI